MLARPAPLLALFKPPQKKPLEDTPRPGCSIVSPGPGTPSNHHSAQSRADWFEPSGSPPPPLLFLTAFIPRSEPLALHRGILAPALGLEFGSSGKGGMRGRRGRKAGGCRDRGFPPPQRGVSDRFLSRDKFFPRGTLTDLRGRAPSHHLWPRNVSPSHVTPFHRRFRRYSISGNTAAHLRAALNNRAAWPREAVPEERCFSKLSHLSTGFFSFFFFSFPPLCRLLPRDLSNPF